MRHDRKIAACIAGVAGLLALLPLPAAAETATAACTPVSAGIRAVIAIGMLVVIGFLIWLARSSDILRDSQPIDFAGAAGPGGSELRRPFSLAQTQMAWWFVIVLGCYVYLFAACGTYNTLTSQALILMGIGTGTALGAAMVERGKSNPTLQSFQDIVSRIDGLRTQGAPSAMLAPLLLQRDRLARRLAATTFLDDILTDVDGISLHRFQNLVWTVLLGGIFAYQTVTLNQMPEFNQYMLAILGISAGTYLGFKIPEQPS
ncbi:MAG TPA: hypothetical protein VEU47_20535 [Candidatus Cybelea sp.]|nr:hypothetical protein [Candidatus Cybelea sp.]